MFLDLHTNWSYFFQIEMVLIVHTYSLCNQINYLLKPLKINNKKEDFFTWRLPKVFYLLEAKGWTALIWKSGITMLLMLLLILMMMNVFCLVQFTSLVTPKAWCANWRRRSLIGKKIFRQMMKFLQHSFVFLRRHR